MRRHRALLTGIAVLLSGTLLFSSAMIWKELSGRPKEKEEFSALAELVEAPEANPPVTSETPPAEADEPDEAAELRDLAPLFAQNGDCIGWLSIPGTQINYPVMHTPEEPQKYLRRSFYGEYSQSGVPFLDWRCSLDSDNLIIYGHNMKNGSMFGTLRKFYEDEVYEKATYFWIYTPDKIYRYDIFSCAEVPVDSLAYQITFSEEGSFEKYIDDAYSRSVVKGNDIKVTAEDKIVTLSTCTGNESTRFIVQGKLSKTYWSKKK